MTALGQHLITHVGCQTKPNTAMFLCGSGSLVQKKGSKVVLFVLLGLFVKLALLV
jgi:hypothetical protein